MPLPVLSSANIVAVKAAQVATTQSGGFSTFDSRPVWFVTVKPNTKVVVKAEVQPGTRPSAAKDAKWGAKLMRHASSNNAVKADVLTNTELDALRNFQIPPLRMIGNAQLLADHRERETSLRYLKFVLAQGGSAWMKMEFVRDLLSVEGAIETHDAKDLLETLRATDALISLGQVVAVDIFIGNGDRFVVEGNDAGTVRNQGNILFRKLPMNLNRIEAVGLDWYEAQGSHSALHTAPPQNWAGLLLKDDARLRLFANKAIDSMNQLFFSEILAKALEGSDLIDRVGIDQFLVGLFNGRKALKEYLNKRQSEGKSLPNGIRQRMEKLGWNQARMGGWEQGAGQGQRLGQFGLGGQRV